MPKEDLLDEVGNHREKYPGEYAWDQLVKIKILEGWYLEGRHLQLRESVNSSTSSPA